MATQKAIEMVGEPGKAAFVTDRRLPRHRPGYVLVDVKAVALNPTDWKHIDRHNTKGGLCGCDYAGVVAETGEGYTKDWKVGDRIAGFAHGGNQLEPEDGAFAQRIAVKADIAFRIPDHVTFEQASTLGVGVTTVGLGLFQQMGLKWPPEPSAETSTQDELILVYGGGSATGAMGIQFLNYAGYRVIAAASPSNHDLVKSLGAEAAFDYRQSNVVDQINKYTRNNLNYVWDTISLPQTAQICADVISTDGNYGAILALKSPREDVKTTNSVGYRAVGEPVEKNGVRWDDNAAIFEFTKKWVNEVVEPYLAAGRIKFHPLKLEKGIQNVFEGLDLLKQDKVSGQKLVYSFYE